MTVSPSEIEVALDALKVQPYDPRVFPLRFLEAHDLPKSTISRLKTSIDASLLNADVIIPKRFCFRHTEADPGEELARMMGQKATKSSARFLLTTDGRNISGFDRATGETWHDQFDRLNDHFNMTLPLAGIERYKSVDENPADIKAAGRLAKFYDAILEANKDWISEDFRHALNLFMTRVLFCMFAEDTGIIADEVFTKTLEENTKTDGSDVAQVMARVFEAMNLKIADRGDIPAFVRAYPYVNGGLFRDQTPVPVFSRKSRRILIDACQLDWAEINPDIFGSMIQGVVDPEKRGELGMHYTSVPNIMKLIGPLFLDAMKSELQAAGTNVRKLQALLTRIYNLRIFDPACGSGNFLIISYRELRRLELAVLQRLQELPGQAVLPMSQVRLSQFYGIEYTDFAAETAKLSLWIAEHQANKEFRSVFGTAPPDLPLRDAGNIVRGNALRENWNAVCRVSSSEEVYVVGNPPYLGRAQQSEEQKTDMAIVFDKLVEGYAKLDYVSAWLFKSALYLDQKRGAAAFVTTNSICQGEQVYTLWPAIINRGFKIKFAHTSFKWSNSAARKAGVTCVIVGIGQQDRDAGLLFTGESFISVPHINPYLVAFKDVYVKPSRHSSIAGTRMNFGSMPNDAGNLIFRPAERAAIISEHPSTERLFRRLYGTQEYVKNIERWCLWVTSAEDRELVEAIPPLARRTAANKQYRLDSDRAATKALATVPFRFGEVRHEESDHVFLVPSVYSEKRKYVSCGVLTGSPIISNLAFSIYNGPMWVLGLLLSRLHACWIETVCGQLETRIRYSNTLGFNTFPMPEMSAKQQASVESAAWSIIEARSQYAEDKLADLYDPEKMPKELQDAHDDLDAVVERIYKGRPFIDDAERIQHLFKMYELTNKSSVVEEVEVANAD
jgi:hypothetical protein